MAPADAVAMVEKSLDDDKAENIVTIDLAGKTSVTDHMIIASGRSDRHVGALASHLTQKLKEVGVEILATEGLSNCDWVLIDAGDMVIHLFRPDVRTFYNLEKMWAGPELAGAVAQAGTA